MEIRSDFLVIGTGIAGLTYALKASKLGTVVIITKKGKTDTSTSYAQGGIASVFAKDDAFDLHIQDTLACGDGLCHEDVVEMVIRDAPVRVQELVALGVNFDPDKNSAPYDLTQEGGHSRRRIVHVQDFTGQAVERALISEVEANKNISIYEHHLAVDLITHSKLIKRGTVTVGQEESCCGGYVLESKNKEIHIFLSKITVLATGGVGKVYLYTSNPDVATGDGITMGYRAGTPVANMEFVQFHPTCLYHPHAKNFLISETLRGEGGRLIDKNGNHFMDRYHPMGDLAFRDIVARAIDAELKNSGDDCVFLDVSHKDSGFLKNRFPNVYHKCLSLGIDITQEPIPVVPAAHYMCGGVLTDTFGRTKIGGLYAIGETACTGLHGANRLASNSLLEALVFANRASLKSAEEIKERKKTPYPGIPTWDIGKTSDAVESVMISHNWDVIRRLMWNYVGIVRNDRRLNLAKSRVQNIQDEISGRYWDYHITGDFVELRNIATAAKLIIDCAIIRKESRGLHFNVDYSQKDDVAWKKDTIIERG
jgi:L-aspartate oxidase